MVSILKTLMFVNDWYLFLFFQNHSAITQLFYVMTSSSLRPLVNDLYVVRCYESCFFTKLKNFGVREFAALAAMAQSAPPISQHLPTPLITTQVLFEKSSQPCHTGIYLLSCDHT